MNHALTMSTVVDVRSLNQVKSNLRQYGNGTLARIKGAVEDSRVRWHNEALSLCPYDTEERDDFHMIEHLHAEPVDNGYGYEGGFTEDEFAAEGQPPYFIYTEFGTRFMAAQPCIFPARDIEAPRFRAGVAIAIRSQ